MTTNTAVFAQTPMIGLGVLTAASANTTTTSPTNMVQLAQVGEEGAIITSVSVLAMGTTTATCVGLWASTNTGTTKVPLDNVVVPAYTAATTTAGPKVNFADITEDNPIRVPGGTILYGNTQVAVASGLAMKVEYSNF